MIEVYISQGHFPDPLRSSITLWCRSAIHQYTCPGFADRESLSSFPNSPRPTHIQTEVAHKHPMALSSLNVLVGTAFVASIVDGVVAKNFEPSNLSWWGNGTSNWLVSKRFDVSTNCSDSPNSIIAGPGCNITETDTEQCIEGDITGRGTLSEVPHAEYWFECVQDPEAIVSEAYGDSPFLRIDYFADSSCAEFNSVTFYAADGECPRETRWRNLHRHRS